MNMIFLIMIHFCTTDNSCTWKEFKRLDSKESCIQERTRLRREFGIKSICKGEERQ